MLNHFLHQLCGIEVIRAVLLRGRTGNQSADQASFTFTPLFVNFVRSSAVQLQSDLSSSDSLAPCLEHMFHFFSKQLKQCEDGKAVTLSKMILHCLIPSTSHLMWFSLCCP
jgi:hypothetical protein